MKQVLPRFYKPVKPPLESLSKHLSTGIYINLSSVRSSAFINLITLFLLLFSFYTCCFGIKANMLFFSKNGKACTSYSNTSLSATFISSIISSFFKILPSNGIGKLSLVSFSKSLSIYKTFSPVSSLHNLAIFNNYSTVT